MDDLQGTLGYNGRKGSKNLGELVSEDYPTFRVFYPTTWRVGLHHLTTNNFQVSTSEETMMILCLRR